jgi:spore photoproduct lyase
MNFYNKHFSHIYVEKNIKNNQKVIEILQKFNKSNVIYIEDYKEIFNQKNNNYQESKKSLRLILAYKKDNFIYNGSRFCDNYDFTNYYYTNILLNCIYDCDYCFLKGMYDNSSVVLFINYAELLKEIKEKEDNSYISLCYETDILAFNNSINEDLIPFHYELIKDNPNKTFEIRTKSSNINYFLEKDYLNNLIISFTLSPNYCVLNYEKRTASLDARINAINKLLEKGYKVRICFDPMLHIKDYINVYQDFFSYLKNNIDFSKIYDISVGTFRISQNYFKKLKKNCSNNDIINYPYNLCNQYYGYDKTIENELIDLCVNNFKENKLFIWR